MPARPRSKPAVSPALHGCPAPALLCRGPPRLPPPPPPALSPRTLLLRVSAMTQEAPKASAGIALPGALHPRHGA